MRKNPAERVQRDLLVRQLRQENPNHALEQIPPARHSLRGASASRDMDIALQFARGRRINDGKSRPIIYIIHELTFEHERRTLKSNI